MIGLGGACGLCECDLEVLQVGLASFFQDKGPSVGGERNKHHLSPHLVVFSFRKTREVVDCLGFESGIFGLMRSFG